MVALILVSLGVVLLIGPIQSYRSGQRQTERLRLQLKQAEVAKRAVQGKVDVSTSTPSVIADARSHGYLKKGEIGFRVNP